MPVGRIDNGKSSNRKDRKVIYVNAMPIRASVRKCVRHGANYRLIGARPTTDYPRDPTHSTSLA